MHKKNIESLQVLRGFAAILVFLFHASGTISVIGYSYAVNTLRFGSSGVDIFFVLSGFIIYYTSVNKKTTSKEFFMRRFVRIFLIYWVALSLTLVGFFVEKFIIGSESITVNTIQSGGMPLVLKSIFLIPTPGKIIIPVAWTLSYELVFYLLFGLFFYRDPRKFMHILVFWVLFNFLNYFCLQCKNFFHPVIVTSLSSPIIIEFLYGCIIAIIITRYTKMETWKHGRISIILGCLFFIASLFFQEWISNHSDFRMFFYGLPAALIVYGAIYLEFSMPRFLTYLGDASYSIYLFHPLLLSVIIKLLFILKIDNHFSNFWGVTFIILMILFLCCCIYNFIEKPLLKFAKKFLSRISNDCFPMFKSI
jgi:exopolysaccharide production protein ExoZ